MKKTAAISAVGFMAAIAVFILAGLLFSSPKTVQAALINATGVLGQTDANGNFVYTTGAANNGTTTPNAQGMNFPFSSVLDPVGHRLFVMDSGNNRVMAFQLDSVNHIATTTATFILGASTFTAGGSGGCSAGTFEQANLAYDSANSRLFVSDGLHNRVLAFSVPTNATSSINGENASFVLGQTSFNSCNHGTATSTLYTPDDIVFDSVNNRLFVSDGTNNRIMTFSVPANATSSINGENAVFELGSPDFVSNGGDTTQSALLAPTGLAIDTVNNRLFVSDYLNNRVMVFGVPANATSSINGENASYVLGEPSFDFGVPFSGQKGFTNPDDILGYDPTTYRLFVSDFGRTRVMVFVVPPGTNISFENAQNVLGQNDYSAMITGVTQNRFSNTNGQDSFDPVNNRIFIKDRGANRIIEDSMIRITTNSLASSTVGIPYSQTISVTAAQGTSQTYSIYSGSLPPGLSLSSSTGVISGTPTTATTTSVTIEADDNFATGPFFYRTTYSLEVDPDTQPPVVAITSPSSGATLSESVTLFASATDNAAVAGVQFQIDGANVGPKVTATSSPNTYTQSWNTASYTNTPHIISAIAYDASNNTSTASTTVTVSNIPVIVPAGGSSFPASVVTPAALASTTTPATSTPSQSPSSSMSSLPQIRLINNNGTFYLIISGQRHGITSQGILNSYGLEFTDAVLATSADLALPQGDLLPPANGSLAKSLQDQTVYLISNGQRYGFVSGSVFKALGYDFASVLTVTNPELQALPKAGDLSNSQAAHLSGTDINLKGTIYLIGTDNKLHGYPSLTVYNSWHRHNNFGTVVKANPADQDLPVGDMVTMRVLQ